MRGVMPQPLSPVALAAGIDHSGESMADRGYALVTGASSGIGAAFARALAQRGQALLLTARSRDALLRLQQELQRPDLPVRVIPADLSTDAGVESLLDTTRQEGWAVDLLVNNAGFGSGGDFAQLDQERELQMLQLNVRALVRLTHACLAPMRERRRGAIVNVASTAAFQPVPYMATYSASKAFVFNFSMALWRENRDLGVHVMALCPGTTATHFFEVARIEAQSLGMQTPEAVVAAALHGLDHRRPYVISGWHNRLMVASERLAPRTLITDIAARFIRRRQEG